MEMERVSEEANCRRVRVFRWNEKLSIKKGIWDYDAILMLRITNKFITEYEEIIQRSSDKLFRFSRVNLLSHDSFKSVIISYPYLSKHLLPNTVLNLGTQISTYLFSRFRFTPQNLILRNQPRIVIVVDIHRIRTPLVDYSTSTIPWSLCPPPPGGHLSYSSSGEQLNLNLNLNLNRLSWDEEDPELFNFMLSICYELGDPLKPIDDNEPVGFFEVDPKSDHVWVRRREEG